MVGLSECERKRPRGQLLLAGAFVLAIALIGLTLVFSAGNYATTLATEDDAVAHGSDAISERRSLQADLGGYLAYINSQYSSLTPASKAQFEQTTTALGEEVRDHYAHRGRLVEIDPASPTYVDGIQVKQVSRPPSNSFAKPSERGGSPPGSWPVVENTRVRNVTFVFSDVPPTSNRFTIRFRVAGGHDWELEVYRAGGDRYVRVVERDSSGTAVFDQNCGTGTSGEMVLNVSAATVDGTYCPPLETLDPASDEYDVVFVNGEDAEGRFWLTAADTSGSTVQYVSSGDSATTTEREGIIYAATVRYSYQSAVINYEGPLRIAPGEIR